MNKKSTGCNIEYVKDNLKISGMAGGLMAMDIFVLISHSLSLEYPNNYKEKLKLIGKEHFKPIIKIYKNKNLPNIKAVKYLLEQIKISGLGKIKLFNIDKNRFIVNIYNGSYPNQYKKLFGLQKEPIDHFMCGIIEETFESVFNKKTKVEEKLCISQGKKNCIFEVNLI